MGKREPLFPGGFRSNGHRGSSKKGCPLTILAVLAVPGSILAGLTWVGYQVYSIV